MHASINDPIEQKLARLEAPVKPQYCITNPTREIYAEALLATSSNDQTTANAVQNNSSALGMAETKSKNKMRKERKQQSRSSAQLCIAFSRGACQLGDKCKYNHDVQAFVSNKLPDLPGDCPFSALDSCPYGICCRWASKHKNPDELTAKYITNSATTTNDNNNNGNGDTTMNTTTDNTNNNTNTNDNTTNSNQWYHHDGSIPTPPATLPTATAVTPSVNSIDKTVQMQLRKHEYSFDHAYTVLEQFGIRNTNLERAEKSKKRRGGDDSRGNNNKDTDTNNNNTNGSNDAHDTKKVRLENSNDVSTAAAAPSTTITTHKTDDAQFIDSIVNDNDTTTANKQPAADKQQQQQPDDTTTTTTTTTIGTEYYVETKLTKREKKIIDFRDKTFLAPLTTVGNLPFRRLCKHQGADITCGEMAMATNLLQAHAPEWALLKRHPDEDLFGVQLCGGFADSMSCCAQLVQESCNVDFIDINFGCPIDVVTNKGAGSACLRKPKRMEDIVKSMSKVLDCPLTLKMRKGYNDDDDVAHTLIPKVAQWGASAVTLHGRTRQQRYSRLADWEYIHRCSTIAQESGIQLVGNGDVMSYHDHVKAVDECGVATTYVARGALIKPWIFTEIKERRDWDISASERFDLIKKYASFGLEHWGSDERGVETCRRFLLEWLSFAYRYIPVGLLDVVPQQMNWRPPVFVGRNDLETLLSSPDPRDWISISEMLLGPVKKGFVFTPKHKASSYSGVSDRVGGFGGGGGGGQENG